MESFATILLILMGVCLIGLAMIWRELRVINGPSRARQLSERVVLPMSTNMKVTPGQPAQITARGDHTFKPERLFISNAGTKGGAADWVVNDIKLAGKSIFAQSGDIPGDLFGTEAVNSFLTFGIIYPGQSVQMTVTYIGEELSGVAFFASIVGTRLRKRQSRDKRRDKTIVEVATA